MVTLIYLFFAFILFFESQKDKYRFEEGGKGSPYPLDPPPWSATTHDVDMLYNLHCTKDVHIGLKLNGY